MLLELDLCVRVDLTVNDGVGMSANHSSAATAGDFVLYDDATQRSFVALTGSTTAASDMTLNDNIGIDSLLSVYWGDWGAVTSPSAINDPIAKIYLRRRAT